MPNELYPDQASMFGNNTITAMDAYLNNNLGFEIDTQMDARLQISVAPCGYLKRLR